MTPSIFKILNTLGFGKRVGFIKRDGEGVVDTYAKWTLADSQKEKDLSTPTETAEGSFYLC